MDLERSGEGGFDVVQARSNHNANDARIGVVMMFLLCDDGECREDEHEGN